MSLCIWVLIELITRAPTCQCVLVSNRMLCVVYICHMFVLVDHSHDLC